MMWPANAWVRPITHTPRAVHRDGEEHEARNYASKKSGSHRIPSLDVQCRAAIYVVFFLAYTRGMVCETVEHVRWPSNSGELSFEYH